ncbi:MAG: hypothetical protein LBG69_06840 [Zoogloeaceae bacterium]|jgi:type IV pilus assembly protein PilY1|nr:hypothetical protein [Zoogloeaceae bacterium]
MLSSSRFIPPPSPKRSARGFGGLRGGAAAAAVFLGVFSAVLPEAARSVDIEQAPLVLDKTIEPNVVLGYQQTGSMGNPWAPHFPLEDYYFYQRYQDLSSRPSEYQNGGATDSPLTYPQIQEGDRLIFSSALVNQIFYDPRRTYQPPLRYVDGKLKRYPNSDTLSTFPVMNFNGFGTLPGENDTTYQKGFIRLDVRRNAPPAGVHYWYHSLSEGGWRADNGADTSTATIFGTGSHTGVELAGYIDYVPGFGSMRDNPNYNAAENPEESQNNYEYWAFRTPQSGAFFRTSRTDSAFKSRTDADNRRLVRQRACPTIFLTTEESRLYYEGEKEGPVTGRKLPPAAQPPKMAADDDGVIRGIPHGQCRNMYRVWGPASMGNVKGYASTDYFRRDRTTDAPVDARPINLPNGRPWCMRRTYTYDNNPKGSTSLGYIQLASIPSGISANDNGIVYAATRTWIQGSRETDSIVASEVNSGRSDIADTRSGTTILEPRWHQARVPNSVWTPLEYTPFTDTWAAGSGSAREPETSKVRMPLNCFAGRHVIGDVNGDGIYDSRDKARENEPVSYFAYQGKKFGKVMPIGSDANAETTCLPGDPSDPLMKNACGNLNGPEQSLLHLTDRVVDENGELVMVTPRRRTGKEEIRNYMNWFSYYRTRAMAAKSAMTQSFGALLDHSDTTRASDLMKGQFIRLGYTPSRRNNNGGGGYCLAIEDLNPSVEQGPGQYGCYRADRTTGSGIVPLRDFPADAKHPDDVLPDGVTPKPDLGRAPRAHPYAGKKFVEDFYRFITLGLPSWGDSDNYGGRRLHLMLNTIGKYLTTKAPWRTYPPADYVYGRRGEGGQDGDDGKVYGCRRSFAIIVGDGDTEADGSGETLYWPNLGAQAVSTTTGPSICPTDTGNTCIVGKENYQYKPQSPFTSLTTSRALQGDFSDVALYYWMRDLRPDVPNLVAPTTKNPAFWQHMQTFTMNVGADGSLTDTEVNALLAKAGKMDKDGYYLDENGNRKKIPDIYWAYPGNVDTYYERIDDMMRTGFSGRGGTASAINSEDFARKLLDALTEFSGLPTTSGIPSVGGIHKDAAMTSMTVMQKYNPGTWHSELEGHLQTNAEIQNKAEWKAHEVVREQFSTPAKAAARKVFTWDNGAGAGVAFDTNMPDTIKTVIDSAIGGGGDTCPFTHSTSECRFRDGSLYTVNKLIDWLRGDNTYKDTAGAYASYPNGFRDREGWLLGDAINTTPYLLGSYEFNDYGYASFDCGEGVKAAGNGGYTACLRNAFFPASAVDSYSQRVTNLYARMLDENTRNKGAAFVAANDGMLHALDLSNGEELFAYVPAATHGSLKALADPAYKSTHRYFADGIPMAKDVLFSDEWRSVLVGHTGRGGRSFFALDVEDPKNFSAADVLWEFTNPDLGVPADGEPIITPVSGFNGDNGKWAVMFGNGYNSDSGDACLFIVSLARAPLPVPANFPKYEKICVPRQGQANGLIGVPTWVDTDKDGAADLAYAGDLLGNLWKFDLKSMTVREKLLEAVDKPSRGAAKPQPITAPPLLLTTKNENGDYNNLQVIVATGKYVERDDVAGTQTQSIYGIRDLNVLATNGTATRDKLLARSYEGNHQNTEDTFYFRRPQPDGALEKTFPHTWKLETFGSGPGSEEDTPKYGAGQYGWVIDLNAAGMKAWASRRQGTRVSNVKTEGANMLQPMLLPGDDPCASTRSGSLAEINMMTGGWIQTKFFSSVKKNANIWIGDGEYGEEINRDGKFDKSDVTIQVPDPNNQGAFVFMKTNTTADARGVVLGDPPSSLGCEVNLGTSGGMTGGGEGCGRVSGRQSWRQVR